MGHSEGHGLLFLFVGRRLHVDGGRFLRGGGGGDGGGGGGGGFLAGSSLEQAVESIVGVFTPRLLGVGRVDGELLPLEMKGCDTTCNGQSPGPDGTLGEVGSDRRGD